MNNKEFITAIANKMEMKSKETQKVVEDFSTVIADTMEEGDSLNIQGFGSFEIKKKMERIVVNPGTKQRMLVPPKLVIAFKASNVLKSKSKQTISEK